MLAFRILTTLLVSKGQLVKGKKFVNDRRIGSVQQAVNVFKMRGIDEMTIVDIDASRENRLIDYEFVNGLTNGCFMPLAFGGGVKSLEDVRILLQNGADKIVIGSHATKELLNEISQNLGSQSLSCSVDYIGNSIFNCNRVCISSMDTLDYCKYVEAEGAGEIILQSIERDGTMQGYDIPMIERVCKAVNIPVVASSGAGSYDDFYQAYSSGCSGVSAGAMYAFTELTPKGAKEYLKGKGINVRS
jgi:imidazole glycerol-phosphate synthase subunit HisF